MWFHIYQLLPDTNVVKTNVLFWDDWARVLSSERLDFNPFVDIHICCVILKLCSKHNFFFYFSSFIPCELTLKYFMCKKDFWISINFRNRNVSTSVRISVTFFLLFRDFYIYLYVYTLLRHIPPTPPTHPTSRFQAEPIRTSSLILLKWKQKR
jgi:hypothetical protein